MERRTLGRTGIDVSVLGLGTWAMGGDEWGPSNDAASSEVIRSAVAAGVTLIDTADVYGMGHSESLVAEATRGINGVTIVTKGGWDIYTEPRVVGGSRRRYDAAYLERAVSESLRRLGTRRLDVYLLHNPTRSDLTESDAVATLRRLQREGAMNWVGASVGSEDDARAAIEADLDVLMLPLNAVRNWAVGILPIAASAGIGVICREPLERGLLTGKYSPEATFPEGDHRNDKGRDWLLAARPAIERVKAIAAGKGCAPSAVAIAYPLSVPGVTAVVAGARSPQQMRANIEATEIRLDDDELAALGPAGIRRGST